MSPGCMANAPFSRIMGTLLLLGILLTCSHAAAVNDTCLVKPANETTQCASITRLKLDAFVRVLVSLRSPCEISAAEYACADNSVLVILPTNFLIHLGGCQSNASLMSLDSQYSDLLFSRLQTPYCEHVLSEFAKQFSNLNPSWSKFLLSGIWAREIQRTDVSNHSALGQLFQMKLQPFLTVINTHSLECLLLKIDSCQGFQEVVKGLDMKYPEMKDAKRRELCTIFLSYLRMKHNATGSACLPEGNSSRWIEDNFGRFTMCAQLNDLMGLNKNISVKDFLTHLSVPQLVNVTLEYGGFNDPELMGSICNHLASTRDLQTYQEQLQAALKQSNKTLSPEVEKKLENRSIQIYSTEFNSYGPSNWTDLFRGPWNLAANNISASHLALVPKYLSPKSYNDILEVVKAEYPNITSEKRKLFYDACMKPYLATNGLKPKGLNASDPAANSTDGLVRYIGPFLTYCTPEDLTLFANESYLQTLASNPANTELARSLNLSKEMDAYYTKLLTSAPGVNLSSIPGKFMCYLGPSALKNVSAQQALPLAQRFNQYCLAGPKNTSANGTGIPPTPTPEERQIAVSLVNKLSNFSADTLKTLGPAAVGLSSSQIDGISDKDLEACLGNFKETAGWNPTQSRSIVAKLVKGGHKFESLSDIGSLLNGCTTDTLRNLNLGRLAEDLKNPWVKSQLSNASPAVQSEIVNKIMSIFPGTNEMIQNVPDDLVRYIPKAKCRFPDGNPDVKVINPKQWRPEQASMFFEDLIKSGANISSLSKPVLQGFTCTATNNMYPGALQQLAQAMKDQKAQLDADQMACLTRRLTSNGTKIDFDKCPPEMLLFLSGTNYSAFGGCAQYFQRVGEADVEILPKTSLQRKTLLSEALSCMNISGTNVSVQNARMLGGLACGLDSAYIQDSAQNVLPQLKTCKSFTADQESAIQKALSSGNTQFGSPSMWTPSTLESLGGLISSLSDATIKQCPKDSWIAFLRNTTQSSAVPKSQVTRIIKALVPPQLSRSTAAVCPDNMQITADNVNNVLLPIHYTADELNACIDDQTLVNNLAFLGGLAFSDEQLRVLKGRLDKLYPDGYPESLLSSLGAIIFECNPSDIKKWNISSPDTMGSLLSAGPPNNLVSEIIVAYTNSGHPINASALNAIGQYVCLLNDAQLNSIDPSAIRNAVALDISACNETVKTVLYKKAKIAFNDTKGTAYYNLMKPYIGGAPAEDLKALAQQNLNMDIKTFIGLKPSAVMNLTVDDVKGLLGVNVNGLKDEQNNPVVGAWIKLQKQSDLDKLGIGLHGGIGDEWTTSKPATMTTVARNTGTQGTNAGSSNISPHSGSIFGFLQLLHILLLSSVLAVIL
ncbi:otoancorin-like [Ambystoma mexicanum]|uniref:otoancorin-like n=1 Tax=Ambystoma mexicanum TaxID=8296 RepID=UPI0037E97241